ncbi:hypothetical protein BH11MYX2_BH11MYX2_19800 [soil metagenome]
MKKALLGIPLSVAFIALIIVIGLPLCGTCGSHDEAVAEVIKKCPRALAYLGADPHPARMGWACGGMEISNTEGYADWEYSWVGDKARGVISYRADLSNDVWTVKRATLATDDGPLDLVACAGGVTSTKQVLAQTNADAANVSFSGKVITSSNAAVAVGTECTGSLERTRGSRTAHVLVTCRANAQQAEGTAIYDGTGNFTLDVKDSTNRSDDHIELDDSTGAPGARLSANAGKGTLTVFSRDWEVVVDL